ncbi:hypothetical protein [Micromonospora sp. ATCC 39149]|uniref:hypothetical protein n=1 Tax=Micromonospora sp. (strain ATCC 39149 / NRRL 15099 / SCC 1413) TaxID=219305 RepID=UPI001E4594B5|nr:hypothetical protein [Micromonospora sp. ATCC 39149]
MDGSRLCTSNGPTTRSVVDAPLFLPSAPGDALHAVRATDAAINTPANSRLAHVMFISFSGNSEKVNENHFHIKL